MDNAHRRAVCLYYYEKYMNEFEARWLAGGASSYLSEQPLNIIEGFVTSVLIDTDMIERLRVYANLDDMVFISDENGVRVVEKLDIAELGEEFEGMGAPPAWWGTGQDSNYSGQDAVFGAGDEIIVPK